MAGSIQYIKIARIDANGVDLTTSLETLSTLIIPSGSDNVPFKIESATRFPDYYLYYVTSNLTSNLSSAITSSVNYNIITTPKSSNNVAAVQYTPMPISLGTINSDSLNFLQSATSSIIPGAGGLTYFSPPTDLQNNNQVYIKLQGTASVDGSGGTGLLEFAKGSINDFNAGTGVQVGTNVFMNPNASASLDMEVNTTINFGEVIYLRLKEGGNNFNVLNLTFSPETFLQITGSSNGVAKQDFPLEPFFTTPFGNSDYNVLAGNASQPVSNPFLQDIDYGNGTIIPINNAAIISGSAIRGTVPESYYTSLSSINIKYNGSKNQSSDVNVYNPLAGKDDFGNLINEGTYGQTPSVSLNQSLVAYCDWIGGTTPELNNKVAAHIKYLINENGDAISPNLSPTTIKDVQNNFTKGKNIEVSLIDPEAGSGMQILNGNKEILKGGYRVEPILYSQIPISPFSSSITMETSSLIPVDDVRFGAVAITQQFTNASAPTPTVQFQNRTIGGGSSGYNTSNGIYTVPAFAEESGVTLVLQASLFLQDVPTSSNIKGNLFVRVIKNGSTILPNTIGKYYTDGIPAGETLIVTNTIRSEDVNAGDTYQVQLDLTQLSATFGSNWGFTVLAGSFFGTSQLPSATTNPLITGSMWEFSASRQDVLISTNTSLNSSYNFLKQQKSTDSGFNETSFLFTIEPGDQFRFQDDESKVYDVIRTTSPNSDPNGSTVVFLNKEVSTSVNKDYFLIRRFVEDGSYIIFDENKPAGNSGAAFIKPRFTTDILDKDVDQFIQDLKSKNLLT
jgi:hypothetical protein